MKKRLTLNHQKLFIVYIIPLLVFLSLGIAVMSPVLSDINHKMFGHILPEANTLLEKKFYYDGYQHVWNFWWAKKTCMGLCGDFWHTNYLFWQNNTGLYFHNFSFPNMAIFFLFIGENLSSLGAYNLSFVLSITLSGYFMYLLSKYLTSDPKASIVSGLFYALSPYIMGHLYDGQLDHASIQFFPLLCLYLFKVKDKENLSDKIILGIILFILGTNFSHLVIALILITIFILYYGFKSKSLLTFISKFILPLVVFILPFLFFFGRNILELNKYQLSGKTKWTSEFFSTDLLALITPPETNLIGPMFSQVVTVNFSGINSDNTAYIGITGILFIIIFLFIRQKKQTFWLLTFLTGIILVLGPKLHFNGKILFEWMPYRFFELLPIFNIFRTPSRFGILIYLPLAIIIGYSISKLSLKNIFLKPFLYVFILTLLFIEFFPVNNYISKQYLPHAYNLIEPQDANTPILEYPVLWASGLDTLTPFSPVFMYYQTLHEKPIYGGYLTRLDDKLYEKYKISPELKYFKQKDSLSRLDANITDAIKSYEQPDAYKSLVNSLSKYVIVNKRYTGGAINSVVEELKIKFKLIHEDNDSLLFEIVR